MKIGKPVQDKIEKVRFMENLKMAGHCALILWKRTGWRFFKTSFSMQVQKTIFIFGCNYHVCFFFSCCFLSDGVGSKASKGPAAIESPRPANQCQQRLMTTWSSRSSHLYFIISLLSFWFLFPSLLSLVLISTTFCVKPYPQQALEFYYYRFDCFL